MKENPDCIVARKPCCNRIIYAAVNDPKVIDAEAKKEIGELVAMGCTIEHMTAAEVRKSDFGCKCHKAPNVES